MAPVLSAESLGAIHQGSRLEPVAEAYPAIAAAGIPVLLVVASELERERVERFRAALPEARIETIAGGIHDLVSFAPAGRAARRQAGRGSAAAVDRDRQAEHDVVLGVGQLVQHSLQHLRGARSRGEQARLDLVQRLELHELGLERAREPPRPRYQP